MTLDKVVKACRVSKVTIDKLCKIKKYLPIKDKFKFIEEYEELIGKHLDDYAGYESLVAFVFFHLMVIKTYTDIELELTYEEFDLLQENELINKITDMIGDDYVLLTSLVMHTENE